SKFLLVEFSYGRSAARRRARLFRRGNVRVRILRFRISGPPAFLLPQQAPQVGKHSFQPRILHRKLTPLAYTRSQNKHVLFEVTKECPPQLANASSAYTKRLKVSD